MVKHRSRNHYLDVLWRDFAHEKSLALQTDVISAQFPRDRRALIFQAVRAQIQADNKRPWALNQKLNDAPYRYTRDTLWAALNSISDRLAATAPAVDFGVEGRFRHPTFKSFADFVNGQLTQTVSSLISGIMDASRWA